jgi:O-antigen biosynthesis protein
MPDTRFPRVSVVTVNYNGAELTGALLDSLERQTYRHHEVVVVDNASTDGSVERLRREHPRARIVELPGNAGFVGGNNAGIRAARGELVALANNDTVAEPGWLEALVHTAGEDPRIAAVASKILFLRPFVAVRLIPEGGEVPVFVSEDSAFAGAGYRKPVFREGFHGPRVLDGRTVRRLATAGSLYLPVDDARQSPHLTLGLVVEGAARIHVEVGPHRLASLDLGTGYAERRIEVPAAVLAEHARDLINNAGTALSPSGEAADRGIYEPDRGQYDSEEDLEAVCGAAVLLRRSALEDVGLFDRDFFMYYEDTDLSWRLRERGYRLRYQPRSVIRHVHAAASVEWSPLFTFHTARNKLLMIAKNGSAADFLRAYLAELRSVIAITMRAWRARRGDDGARARGELVIRARVQISLLTRIPRALLKRLGLLPQ